MFKSEDIARLAETPQCPRCNLDKTWGVAMCSACRGQLPKHMRSELEAIQLRDPDLVGRAMRQAASFFRQQMQSIRSLGGGRKQK
jgi:hypothetical protein